MSKSQYPYHFNPQQAILKEGFSLAQHLLNSSRIGRIISIDYEKDTAIAKAEILIPNWRVFTDYFLLLKYEGSWKIVHKSYTWREIPKK